MSSTSSKIPAARVIPAILLAGAALLVLAVCWFLFGGLDPGGFSGGAEAGLATAVGGGEPAAAGQAKDGGGAAAAAEAAEAPHDDRIAVAPSPPGDLCLWGQVEMRDGVPPPRPVLLAAAAEAPPFAFFPLRRLSNVENQAVADQGELDAVRLRPACRTDASGAFLLQGLLSKDEYIVPLDPFLYVAQLGRGRPAPEGEGEPCRVILDEGCCLEGLVRDAAGQSVSGAAVTLRQRFDPMFAFSENKGARAPFSTESDRAGKFQFEGVPCDTDFALDVFMLGHGRITGRQVPLERGAAVPLDIVLPAEACISGWVRGRESRPVPGIEVRLSKTDDFIESIISEESDGALTAKSGEDGGFRFGGLAAGTYKVFISETGYLRTAHKKIALEAGQTRTDLVLLLDEGLAIAGRVVDSEGGPIEGAAIKAVPEFDLTRILDFIDAARFSSTARSDAGGRFRLRGLEEGSYNLEITRSGVVDESHKGIRAGSEDVILTLRSGGIAGIVVSTVDGEPVPDFKLALEPIGRSDFLDPFGFKARVVRTVAHEQGKFEVAPLAPGAYTLSVSARGFAMRALEGIQVEDGRTTPGVLVMLAAEAGVSGAVFDRDSKQPVEGARISLKSGLEALIGEFMDDDVAFSDASGRYRVGGLESGPVRLSVSHARYEPVALEEMQLLEGEELAGCNVYLSRGGVIHGRILGPARQPLAGVTVMASTPTASVLKSAKSGQDGAYELAGFSPGTYQLMRMSRSWRLDENFLESLTSGFDIRVVKLGKDEIRQVDFVVGAEEESGLVCGRVSDSAGPVASALISIVPVEGSDNASMTRTATTNAEGEYSVKNVGPGEYTFRVVRTEALVRGGGAEIVFRTRVPDKDVFEFDMELPGGSIEGRVVDRDTLEPLTDIRLYLKRASPGDFDDPLSEAMGGRVGELYSEPDGSFRFLNLRKGRYDLRAGGANILGMNPGGYAQETLYGIEVLKDRAVRSQRILLERGGTIEGEVKTARSDPVAGASVFFQAAGAPSFEAFSECYSDESGGFAYTGLAEGSYSVAVKHADFAVTLLYNVSVRKEKSTRVAAVMEKGCAVSVRLTGAPDDFAAARIDLVDDAGTSLSGLIGLTDLMEKIYAGGNPSPGLYELGRYAPGTYHIRINHPDFAAPRNLDIVVVPGQDALMIPVSL